MRLNVSNLMRLIFNLKVTKRINKIFNSIYFYISSINLFNLLNSVQQTNRRKAPTSEDQRLFGRTEKNYPGSPVENKGGRHHHHHHHHHHRRRRRRRRRRRPRYSHRHHHQRRRHRHHHYRPKVNLP